jgi:hypothetical protein
LRRNAKPHPAGPGDYGAGEDFVEADVSFRGDLRSLLFPNRSPMSKKLM